jgi:TRAP-type C4-dicarboxylate transport system permease small subunit
MVFLIPVLAYLLFLKGTVKYFWLVLLPSLSFVRIEGFFTYLTLWLALFLIAFFFLNNKTDNLFSQHQVRPVAV